MPVVSAQAFENAIIGSLAVSDPQLSTALGTPVRKIITAVAQEMADYNVDVNTTTTLYSLDSVSGTELDYLVGQFGFTRQEARPAKGSVTVRRDNGDSLLQISYGTQFYKQATATMPSVVFQTTAYQELAEGVLSAEIAVVATVAGAIGNVPANTITYSVAQSGYVNITNANPTSGGRDAETDAQLRQRFLQTVFRNMAGTKDQMLGLALANETVGRANLIGQESRYSEVVQAVSSAGSVIAEPSSEQWDLDVYSPIDVDRRYWVTMTDTQELLGHGDYSVSQDGETVTFKKRDASEVVGPVTPGAVLRLSHGDVSDVSVKRTDTGEDYDSQLYTLDASAGTITIASSGSVGTGISLTVLYKYDFVAAGDFVTIEFDYLSKHNRGGMKTVDLYVDSMSQRKVTDVQYIDFSKKATALNLANWVRLDGSHPVIGHPVIPLSYQPLYGSIGFINMGTSIVLSEGVHFEPIFDATATAGSSRGMDAVEIIGTVSNGELSFTNDPDATAVGDLTPVSIPYLQNYAIEKVQELVDYQRVVTMDVQVHEAVHRRFVVYLTLMYSVFPRRSTMDSVKESVVAWASSLPFGHTIQFSDIETVAANVAGVDNVRVSTSSDAGGAESEYLTPGGASVGAYGLIELNRDGKTVKGQFTSDFRLAQNDIFEISDVVIYSRSQQGWGA